MEIFTKKSTEWMGLWLNKGRSGRKYFSSNAINLDDLRKFDGNVRIIARKNKNYERGSDKPYFVFCISSCDSDNIEKPQIVDKENKPNDEKRSEEDNKG